MTDLENLRKIGEGAFGFVVSPALNNVNEFNNHLLFPGMVTKIMKSKQKYLDALKAIQDIKKHVSSLALDFIPYKRKYIVSNFKKVPFLYPSLKNGKSNDSQVFVVRMPDLGNNCKEIQENTTLYTEYRKRGVEVYCREILKLLRIVKDIKDSGFVHADIRESNVMCNVYTGTLTIIDFDWFSNKENYYLDYPEWFYSHPLEEIITLDRTTLNKIYNNTFDLSKYMTYSTNLVKNKLMYMDWLVQFNNARLLENSYRFYIIEDYLDNFYESIEDLQGFIKQNKTDNDKDSTISTFKDCSYETIDSYGLATALHKLYSSVLYYDEPFSIFLYKDLLMPMLNSNCIDRMTIDKAFGVMEDYIKTNVPSISLETVPTLTTEVDGIEVRAAVLGDKPLTEVVKTIEKRRNNSSSEKVEALAKATNELVGLEKKNERNKMNIFSPRKTRSSKMRGRGRTRKVTKVGATLRSQRKNN